MSDLGPYRLLAPLGSGGMGIVHRAVHRDSGLQVALKSVRDVAPSALSALRRELEVLRHLDHPGIVKVLDDGMEDGLPWYAMELIEGTPLTRLATGPQSTRSMVGPTWATSMLVEPDASPQAVPARARRTVAPESLRAVLTAVARLCDPLRYLHGEGLVHCDLKPENVLVRPSGQPVLVDFGISTRFGGRELLEPMWHGGTPGFVAPELVRGGPVDARADLYAIGCILFFLVSGGPVFQATDARAVLTHHLHTPAPRLADTVEGIPDALDALVHELLAKDPAARIGYADQVARRLADLGADHQPATPTRAYVYLPPHLGRRDARDRLLALLDEDHALVVVRGERGTGRTRFLRHAIGRIDAQVVTATCHPPPAVGRPLPLGPLRPVLRALAEHCRASGEQATRRILGTHAHALAPFDPLVAELVAEAGATEVIGTRIQLFRQLARALVTWRGGPVVLVVDDLHRADALTVDFVRFVCGAGSALGVRVVATLPCDEALPAGLAGPELTLAPLSPHEVGRMVGGMLADHPLPPADARMLHGHTGGNPFFVGQRVQVAVAAGLPPDWARQDLSVDQVIALRVAAPSDHARRVAEHLAALQYEVDEALVERVIPGSAVAVQELLNHRLVERTDHGGLHFVHEAFRTALVEGCDDRVALHRHIAAVLATDPTMEPSVLARHYDRAGDPRALPALLAAARCARRQFANDEAEAHLRRYLELAEGTPPTAERVSVRCLLVHHLLIPRGELDEADAQLALVDAEAAAVGDPQARYEADLGIGELLAIRERDDEALTVFHRCIDHARRSDEPGQQGVVWVHIAIAHLRMNRWAQAVAPLETAIELQQRAGDPLREGVAKHNLGIALRRLGQGDRARDMLLDALALHQRSGNRRFEAMTLAALASIHTDRDAWDEGIELLSQALHINDELGYEADAAITLRALGSALVNAERYEAACHAFASVARRGPDELDQPLMRANWAAAARHIGRLDEAERLLDEEEALFGESVEVLEERALLAVARDADAEPWLSRLRALGTESEAVGRVEWARDARG